MLERRRARCERKPTRGRCASFMGMRDFGGLVRASSRVSEFGRESWLNRRQDTIARKLTKAEYRADWIARGLCANCGGGPPRPGLTKFGETFQTCWRCTKKTRMLFAV